MSFLILILTFIFRIKDIFVPLSFDEGLYSYIGCVAIPSGGLPYSAVFDQKPILVYLPYYLGCILNNSPLSLRIIGFLLTYFTVLFLYTIFKKRFGHTTGLIVVLFELLFGNSQNFEGQYNLLSEQLIKLPLTLLLGLLLLRKPSNVFLYWFSFGLLISWIFLTKQTYLALIIFPLFRLFQLKVQRIQSIMYFLIGFVILPVFILSKYWLNGQLDWLWLGMFGYNIKYYVFSSNSNLWLWFKYFTFRLQWLWPPVLVLPLLILNLLAKRDYRVFGLITGLYFVIGVYSIWLGGNRFFGHYFQLISFPALLTLGVAFAHILDNKISNHTLKKSIYITTIMILCLVRIKAWHPNDFTYHKSQFSPQDEKAIFQIVIKNQPSEKILFVGNSSIFYFLYRLPLALGNTIMTEVPFFQGHQDFYTKFISEFNSFPPHYIVIEDTHPLNQDNRFMGLLSKYKLLPKPDHLQIYLLNTNGK